MLKMRRDARGCDKATRDFLESSFLPSLRSLFYFINGNNKTPSTSPLIGLFIYNKRDISAYENITSYARSTIKIHFIPR